MTPTLPLPLFHSWPILDSGLQFDLGRLGDREAPAVPPLATHGASGSSPFPPFDEATLARHGVGHWQCDLTDASLTWTAHVYELFGLPPGARLSRAETAAQYCEHSRAKMERLRAYAIRHRRGFTLDAEIRAPDGTPRWMRLIAAPIYAGGKAVRLVGFKRRINRHPLRSSAGP